MPLNALRTHTHTSRRITHLAQVILARTFRRLTTPQHHTAEIGRPEHTMSPMELVATLRLAMLRSTLQQQHHHTSPRPSTPCMTLKGQRNPRTAVARLTTHTFSPRRLFNQSNTPPK